MLKTVKLGTKGLHKDHFVPMSNLNIYTLLNETIQDKVYQDLESLKGTVTERAPTSFSTYLYDTTLMHHGLYSIAIRVLVQMVNGFKNMNSSTPYGYFLA